MLKTMKRRLSADVFIPIKWQRGNNNKVGVVGAGNHQLDRVVIPKTKPFIIEMERPDLHIGTFFL